MKKIILNQKSYLLYDEMVEFKKEFDKIKLNDYEFILFPQVCYLSMFNNAKYPVGAQNFYRTKTASFTGEINLQTLSSMNINYTLIGHYERKKLIGETKEFTKEKLFRSLNSKFNTILCVGETKKTNRPFLYIKKDLTYYLKSIEKKNLKYLSIVYEPNWAIGTGEIQYTDKILKTIDQIKQYMKKRYNLNVEVYYGGSIDNDNIKDILELCDGVLLGKASASIKEIKELIEEIK